jgi:hypothetical protein
MMMFMRAFRVSDAVAQASSQIWPDAWRDPIE